MTTLHAHRALLPEGWAADVSIQVDAAGRIAAIAPGSPGTPAPVLVPGMPNVHSHAFQRALAGRAEQAGHGLDSFMTWRERMYALSHRVSPDDIEAIATLLYVEMLEAGYTSVCEFHYLHHGPDGTPHADPAAASRALIRAAAAAGIRLTLLPVLYMHAGFGARPPEPSQAPFIHTVRDYLALLGKLLAEQGGLTRIGIAFHSLRAVSPEAIGEVLAWRASAAPDMPVHIHVAEQLQEVHECEAWSGLRPVEWLLERGAVDEHWCLVHATHMTEAETRWLAATGAVAGLCPTTEANLGDGLFPLAGFLAAGGRIAIGSDSHVSVSPVEELRWLEYGQRLTLGQRNVAASATERHTGARLVPRRAGRRRPGPRPGHRPHRCRAGGRPGRTRCGAPAARVQRRRRAARLPRLRRQPAARDERPGGRAPGRSRRPPSAGAPQRLRSFATAMHRLHPSR